MKFSINRPKYKQLHEYLFDDKDQEYSKLKEQSDWTPNSGRDRCLDMYVEQFRDDNIKGLSKHFKMNITNNEEQSLRDAL